MSSSTSKGKGKRSDKEEGVTTYHLQVHPGLEGFDADLDALITLYEELQQCSVDVADPQLDFLTFASTTHWFGVLTELKAFTLASEEGEHEHEHEHERTKVQRETLTEAERERREQKRLGRKRRRNRRKEREREAKARQMDSGAVSTLKSASSPVSSSSKEIASPAGHATASASTNKYQPIVEPGPPEPGSKLKPTYVDRSAATSAKKSTEAASASTLSNKPQAAAAQLGGDQNRSGRGQAPLPTMLKHDQRQHLQKTTSSLIGFVYLMNKQQVGDYSQSGELHLGVVVDERYRRRGYALEAIQVALERAFAEQNCVRVQALVVDGLFKHAAQNVFMKAGFGHEGTRKRAFRSPYSLEFKDLTCFGILATDWEIRHLAALRAGTSAGASPILHFPISPTSLWESMLERHQREREEMIERHDRERQELLRWDDEKNLSLKLTASSETVGRVTTQAFDGVDPEDSGDDLSD